METKKMSELARNNQTVMIGHIMEAVMITFTFFSEVAVGNRSIGYSLVVMILALAPVIAEIFFWKKSHETKMIKHLAAYGFAVMYTFILFTTTNHLTFLYVIPMIALISVYSDMIYSVKISVGIVIENLIVVIGGAVTGGFGYTDFGSGLLQLMVVILLALYSFLAARTSEQNNRAKMDNIQEAQAKTELALNSISKMSEKMQLGIDDIHEKVSILQGTSEMTKEAMEEVTAGASDTAEAVQKQLRQTEEIQEKVTQVSEAANEIAERMRDTLAVIDTGNKDVAKLVNEVEASVANGADVAEKLSTLDKYIEEMNSIVEIISGITSQTSLLALNASIEAARAGEAGRGFSVVATEISAMANQTKDATANITELIANVSGAIKQVVEVIRGMIDGINTEKESTSNTAESFGAIESNTYVIRDSVLQLTETVEQLKVANQEIADSIQTISAVSEEVSAHANETLHAEEENMSNLIMIAEKSRELIELTQS